jgi:hypothetical protein
MRRNNQDTQLSLTASANDDVPQHQQGKLTKQQKRDLRRNIKSLPSLVMQQLPQQQRPPNSSVYKRETIYPNPCVGLKYPTDRFVTPKDSIYDKVLNTSYNGFLVDAPNKYPDTFHDTFRSSLLSLNSKGKPSLTHSTT